MYCTLPTVQDLTSCCYSREMRPEQKIVTWIMVHVSHHYVCRVPPIVDGSTSAHELEEPAAHYAAAEPTQAEGERRRSSSPRQSPRWSRANRGCTLDCSESTSSAPSRTASRPESLDSTWHGIALILHCQYSTALTNKSTSISKL